MKDTEEAVLPWPVPSERLLQELGLLLGQLPFGCWWKIIWCFCPLPWWQCWGGCVDFTGPCLVVHMVNWESHALSRVRGANLGTKLGSSLGASVKIHNEKSCSSLRTPLCTMLAEKGPNYVCSGNVALQVSYLAMGVCERFVSVSALCPGSQLNASTGLRPVSAARKSFLEIVTIAYKIFPGWELKSWNLLLQVIGSHLFPNDMKIFMLWLNSSHEINSVSLYVPNVHEWVTLTNSECFALLKIHGHKLKRTALYITALVMSWMCGTTLGCLRKNAAKLRVAIVFYTISRFSPVIEFIFSPGYRFHRFISKTPKPLVWNLQLYTIKQKETLSRPWNKEHLQCLQPLSYT